MGLIKIVPTGSLKTGGGTSYKEEDLKKILIPLSILAILAVALLAVGPAYAVAAPHVKVDVCHATGSETNPYVLINVNVNSVGVANDLNGHAGHEGDAWDSFEYPPDSGIWFPGQGNMDNCKGAPTEPPPTETVTPTEPVCEENCETVTPTEPPTGTPPAVTPTPGKPSMNCRDFVNSDGSLNQRRATDHPKLYQRLIDGKVLHELDNGKWSCGPLETGGLTISFQEAWNNIVAWFASLFQR